jgi:hypothetical protein
MSSLQNKTGSHYPVTMRLSKAKSIIKSKKQLPYNGVQLTAAKHPLDQGTSDRYPSPCNSRSDSNIELTFDPEVEPLVTQLLNGDPSLMYPDHINPIPKSGHEPPFQLGMTRSDRKIIETLMEIHEEKMNGRNIPVSNLTPNIPCGPSLHH